MYFSVLKKSNENYEWRAFGFWAAGGNASPRFKRFIYEKI